MASISNLLTEDNLSKNVAYGFDTTLNAKKIKAMFNSVAKEYCTKVKGDTEVECNKTLSRCGLNDKCRLEQICVNEQERYHCQGKTFDG